MPDKQLPQLTRRRLLMAGASASALFLPVPYAWVWAQSSNGLKLLRTPKVALVIGNGKYQHSPLANPANDARGMAAALQEVGFSVTSGLELTQAAMREAIQAFSENLAQSKAVGLFYFAGHGAQLAWRNYLVPVDAQIADINELRERAVDLNSLIAGIRKAGNPMNVIILDACRDNPFGSTARVDQKGLSQLDAPPGTFLAYATSPGNVAIDGDRSENGLYTEHLLREIKVPEAKVEDVFKRVRLGVRLRSKGLQIPWESTSLEQDYWFIPPKEIKKRSEDEATREFEVELALWEKIKAATEPGPLEDYLQRYPSGRFSELAQFRLDQVLSRQGEKKIQVISPADNPYSKGTVVANTNSKVGDSYTRRVTDLLTKLEIRTFTSTITEVTDTEVIYDNGLVADLLGNFIRTPDGTQRSGDQVWGVDYVVGKRWTSRWSATTRAGVVYQTEEDFRVVGREKITFPAGTFNAFVLESNGWNSFGTKLVSTRWVAPDKVRAYLAFERHYKRGRAIRAETRTELVSYRQS